MDGKNGSTNQEFKAETVEVSDLTPTGLHGSHPSLRGEPKGPRALTALWCALPSLNRGPPAVKLKLIKSRQV